MNSNWSPETLNSGKNWQIFVPCDLEIWWMTLKKNRTPLPYNIKLRASFQSHWYIQTGVTVWKRSILCASLQIHQWIQTAVIVWKCSIRVKIDIMSRVTLKFDGWPWKTIGHFFYTTSSSVHHFKAMGEFKLQVSPEMLNSGQNGRFPNRTLYLQNIPTCHWYHSYMLAVVYSNGKYTN